VFAPTTRRQDGEEPGAPHIRAGAGAEGEAGRKRARQHAQRLVEAGATVLHEKDEPIGWCIVMGDPEGNEFCVT
jgi:hypothetical protein